VPSEYVTYLIIFSLGMIVVVTVQALFSGLATNVAADVARVELQELTLGTRDKIMDLLELTRGSSGRQVLQDQINLPAALGGQFRYSISLDADNNQVVGTIPALGNTVVASLGSIEGFTLDGSFDAQSSSVHYVIIAVPEMTISLESR